jgi:hypothetical protein
MIRMIRSSVLALVLAGLVAPAAFAAPGAGRPLPVPAAGFAAVWEWVVLAFAPAMPVFKAPEGGIMEKARSTMDPNGTPHISTFSAESTTDAGSQMDPNGHQ